MRSVRLVLPRLSSIITIGLFLFCLSATVCVWLYPDTVFQGYDRTKTEQDRETTILITRIVLLILCLVGSYKAFDELTGYPATVPSDKFCTSISLKKGKPTKIGPLTNLQYKRLLVFCRIKTNRSKMRSFRLEKHQHLSPSEVNLLCVSTKEYKEYALAEKTVTFDEKHHTKLVDFDFGAIDEPIDLVISSSDGEKPILEADIRLNVGMRAEKLFRRIGSSVFTETMIRA